MNDFLKNMLGDLTVANFIAAFVQAAIGALLSLSLQANNREPGAPRTPFHFSWAVLWNDNVKRILTSVGLIYLGVRFGPELLGTKVTMWSAVLLGFGLDKLSQKLKDSGILGAKKTYTELPTKPPVIVETDKDGTQKVIDKNVNQN